MFLSKLVCKVVHQHFVKVIAAQMGVAVGCQYFEYPIAKFQDRYIEGTAAQVVYQNLVGAFFLVESVCKGSCGRLVDDSLYIKTCDSARVLGGLFLSVREVSRNRDNRFRNLFAQISLSIVL